MRYLLILIFSSAILSAQKSVIIGDSQTYWIAQNTKLAQIEPLLCKSGIGLSRLITMISQYNEPKKQVKNVFVCIGVNDNYHYEEVGFMKNLKRTFPNAKIYMIKGSYGWGNTPIFKPEYYDNFDTEVLKNGIGKGDPHKNKNSYKLIGKEIDEKIRSNSLSGQ